MTPTSHNASAYLPDMLLLRIAEHGGRSGGAACPQDAKRVGDNALHLCRSILQSSVGSENPKSRFSRRENIFP
jgi:hypothetical protein